MSLSINLLPEISTTILYNFNPSQMSGKEVRECGRGVLGLLFFDKQIKDIALSRLAELKKINEMINKYCIYNDQYDEAIKRSIDVGGPPQLLDALLTETNFHYVSRSIETFSIDTENDIRTIVKLMPLSINCTIGQYSMLESIYPIFAACINPKISASTIEFLLKSKANQELQDEELLLIEENVSNERYEIIVNLLSKKT